MAIVESSVVVTHRGAPADFDLRAQAEFLLDGVDLAWAFEDGPELAALSTMTVIESESESEYEYEVCSLGSGPKEWERLRRQSEELRPNAEFLLNQVTLWPEHEVVDFGCGPGGVLDCLAERVGPFGRVVGIDPDPRTVAVARSFRDKLGLANVTIEQGDLAHSGLATAAFDLAHARHVLHSSPDPFAIVTEMSRVVRPGGWVVSAEDDHICPRVPELFADAGLVDIGYDVRIEFGFFMTWGRKPSTSTT